MKIHEMHLVEKNKWGRLLKNGVSIEPHEEKTAKFLIRLGLNIDLIRPNNTPKMNNPDFLMSGTIWEVKAPTKYNENTLKLRFKKASKQADKIIIDLRNIKTSYDIAEKMTIKLFIGNQKLRRMILITKEKKALDFRKK